MYDSHDVNVDLDKWHFRRIDCGFYSKMNVLRVIGFITFFSFFFRGEICAARIEYYMSYTHCLCYSICDTKKIINCAKFNFSSIMIKLITTQKML